MPLRIFDFECKACGTIFEEIVDTEQYSFKCPKCGKDSRRIISGSHRNNDCSGWLKTVLEVVEKDSSDPHTREFVRDPTRTNYRKWMKSTGLRPFEPGEENFKVQEPDMSKVTKGVWDNLQKSRRVEVR